MPPMPSNPCPQQQSNQEGEQDSHWLDRSTHRCIVGAWLLEMLFLYSPVMIPILFLSTYTVGLLTWHRHQHWDRTVYNAFYAAVAQFMFIGTCALQMAAAAGTVPVAPIVMLVGLSWQAFFIVRSIEIARGSTASRYYSEIPPRLPSLIFAFLLFLVFLAVFYPALNSQNIEAWRPRYSRYDISFCALIGILWLPVISALITRSQCLLRWMAMFLPALIGLMITSWSVFDSLF